MEQIKKLNRYEIIAKYRERREKFAYYLMGLNVAAIGFTLSKTYDIKEIHLNHLFLGIALSSWLLSILHSFRWILTEFQGMQLDMHQYDIDDGVIETWFEEGDMPEGYKEAIQEKVIVEKAKKANRSEKDYNRVLFFFMGGIVFFIMWRLMEIANILV